MRQAHRWQLLRVHMNGLYTSARLHAAGVVMSIAGCPFCSYGQDCVLHLMECAHVVRAWDILRRRPEISNLMRSSLYSMRVRRKEMSQLGNRPSCLSRRTIRGSALTSYFAAMVALVQGMFWAAQRKVVGDGSRSLVQSRP